MVIWLGIGVAAAMVLFAPRDALITLFFAEEIQTELLRVVAAVTVLWSAVETRALWRGIGSSPVWRATGWIGLALLGVALLTSYPTALFFSFPLLVGATLSTAMVLAESWRETVLTQNGRRSR
jgi:hypothetical protein